MKRSWIRAIIATWRSLCLSVISVVYLRCISCLLLSTVRIDLKPVTATTLPKVVCIGNESHPQWRLRQFAPLHWKRFLFSSPFVQGKWIYTLVRLIFFGLNYVRKCTEKWMLLYNFFCCIVIKLLTGAINKFMNQTKMHLSRLSKITLIKTPLIWHFKMI